MLIISPTALEKVIDWISKTSHHTFHDQTDERRFVGIGEWFLKTEKYLAWSVSREAKLWVTAIRASCPLFPVDFH